MKVRVDADLLQRLKDFAEENWSAFLQRCIEGGIPEDEVEDWFNEG